MTDSAFAPTPPGAPERRLLRTSVRAHRRANQAGPCELLSVSNLADVAPRPIDWLWPGRIARGKITVLTGSPGLGKTLAALSVAATVTRGGAWPCGEGHAGAGNVVVLAGKDGLTDTLRPRIDTAGGDPARVDVVCALAVKDRFGGRAFDLAQDMTALEALITARGVSLLIVDPGGASLRKADARAVLEALTAFAEHHRLAVLMVAQSGSAVARLCGSGAFGAACFAICRDPADAARRLLLQRSNTLSAPTPPLAFVVEQREVGRIDVPCIAWSPEPTREPRIRALASPRSEAAAVLLQRLLAAGALPAREIEARAVAAGLLEQGVPISNAGPFRAAKALLDIRIERRTHGLRGSGEWIWSLPGVH